MFQIGLKAEGHVRPALAIFIGIIQTLLIVLPTYFGNFQKHRMVVQSLKRHLHASFICAFVVIPFKDNQLVLLQFLHIDIDRPGVVSPGPGGDPSFGQWATCSFSEIPAEFFWIKTLWFECRSCLFIRKFSRRSFGRRGHLLEDFPNGGFGNLVFLE